MKQPLGFYIKIRKNAIAECLDYQLTVNQLKGSKRDTMVW